MRDRLGYLVLGQSILETEVEVRPKLIRATEGNERRNRDKAVVALREARTLPNVPWRT